MSERSLANLFFDADRARDLIETKIDDAIIAAGIEWSHWTADSYDSSIEIFGCPGLSSQQQSALWSAGFIQAWSHPGDTKVKELERHYAAPALTAALSGANTK